jgi:hypothetical protein
MNTTSTVYAALGSHPERAKFLLRIRIKNPIATPIIEARNDKGTAIGD